MDISAKKIRKKLREEEEKKGGFLRDLPFYIILLGIVTGGGFLARWLFSWDYPASFTFAVLSGEFLFSALAWGIFKLAKATGARTTINSTLAFGLMVSGLLGVAIMLILKLAVGLGDPVTIIIAVVLAVIGTVITFLIAKFKKLIDPLKIMEN